MPYLIKQQISIVPQQTAPCRDHPCANLRSAASIDAKSRTSRAATSACSPHSLSVARPCLRRTRPHGHGWRRFAGGLSPPLRTLNSRLPPDSSRSHARERLSRRQSTLTPIRRRPSSRSASFTLRCSSAASSPWAQAALRGHLRVAAARRCISRKWTTRAHQAVPSSTEPSAGLSWARQKRQKLPSALMWRSGQHAGSRRTGDPGSSRTTRSCRSLPSRIANSSGLPDGRGTPTTARRLSPPIRSVAILKGPAVASSRARPSPSRPGWCR